MLVYGTIWLVAALALAPYPLGEAPPERYDLWTFLETPLLAAVGLILLLPPPPVPTVLPLVFAGSWLLAHAVATLTVRSRSVFQTLCAMHILQLGVAVWSFVAFTWRDGGG